MDNVVPIKKQVMKTSQTFDELTGSFKAYLQQIGRQDRTVHRYAQLWARIKIFMDTRHMKFYNRQVGEVYLNYLFGSTDYSKLTKYYQVIWNNVEALAEFQDTGTIFMGKRRNPPIVLEGPIGTTMEDFVRYKRSANQIGDRTTYNYRLYLNGFLMSLTNNGIQNVDQITPSVIMRFINMMPQRNLGTKHTILTIVKAYLKYLYERTLTVRDHSTSIPKVNYKSQSRLPSSFSREEVKTLLESIDRGSPRGKRDYAILLLAATLGLRASDIAGLRFEHILWEQHLIKLPQMKTQKNINLPLLPEIGNAIIDYLKNGRPLSREPYCFLQIISPYRPINSGSVGNIARYHLNTAGINYEKRRHGPHALRHSLAESLLQNKVPIPVISEVLGHVNTESTMFYTRIDLGSLKQCALDVPLVDPLFYGQKGENQHG